MNLEYLRHGKALCGKVFRRFVETFNFHNDFVTNLKGDADLPVVGGRVNLDRTDERHPVIRCSGCAGGGGGNDALEVIVGIEISDIYVDGEVTGKKITLTKKKVKGIVVDPDYGTEGEQVVDLVELDRKNVVTEVEYDEETTRLTKTTMGAFVIGDGEDPEEGTVFQAVPHSSNQSPPSNDFATFVREGQA